MKGAFLALFALVFIGASVFHLQPSQAAGKCEKPSKVAKCDDPKFTVAPKDRPGGLGVRFIKNGSEGSEGGALSLDQATHIWDRREKLCTDFSFSTIISSSFSCLREAIRTFEAPDCDIKSELEWDVFFEDEIELSTNQVTDTNFRLGWCPGESVQGGDMLNITLEDVRMLDIEPSPVLTYPEISAKNPRIINMPLAVYSQSSTQNFSPTLLGETIQVRVVPVAFTFDWGDGVVLGPVTSPGAPDSDSSYSHTYTSLKPLSITLTTQWAASWSRDGISWIRIPGTLTTSSATPQLPIVEKVPLLVPDN